MLTRDVLIDRIWGPNYFGDTKTLDVHVKRLRAKVEDDSAAPDAHRDRARRRLPLRARLSRTSGSRSSSIAGEVLEPGGRVESAAHDAAGPSRHGASSAATSEIEAPADTTSMRGDAVDAVAGGAGGAGAAGGGGGAGSAAVRTRCSPNWIGASGAGAGAGTVASVLGVVGFLGRRLVTLAHHVGELHVTLANACS